MSLTKHNPYSIDQPAEALFYGRQGQVEKLVADLTAPIAGSYALIGGRRFGKTSILHAVERRLWATFSCPADDGYSVIPVYINLLGDEITGLESFFSLAIDILTDQMSEHSPDLIPENWSISLPSDSDSPAHRAFAERVVDLCRSIAQKDSPVRVLLLLDETEEILDRPWRHDLFNRLRWLIYENRRTRNYLKIILAGSSSFHSDVRQTSSPLWGVLKFEYLVAFPESETLRLIQEPCEGQVPETAARKIVRYSGGHPYLVQYLMHHLWRERLPDVSPQRVLELTERFMREHWSQLESWQKSIGNVGRQVYTVLSSNDDWMEENAIREAIGRPAPDLVPALIALCYHGLAIHDDNWRYRAIGELFREWFTRNVNLSVRSEGEKGQYSIDYSAAKEKAMSEFTATAHALLIGVGDYPHPRYADLPATVRDAQALAAVLTDLSRCGYLSANVHVLIGEQTTAANIRAALESLTQSTNSQSTVFIYFSGHGGRTLENGAWRTYLCPREADPDNLAPTAIPGDEFSALLAAIPARKLLVMLDACHAGGSADLKAADGSIVWKAGLSDDYYEALSQGSGRVVIASSKEDQFSYVRGELSLFTQHLVQALNGKAAVRGDGLIHVLDVFHYVNEAVQADETKQVPILKVKDLDLNFPIALDRGGKGAGPAISVTPITDIREQIVRDPIGGAKALSEYLKTRPEWAAKRNDVDLKRADLEHIQHELDLFGPNLSDQAAKNRAVYFFSG